MTATQNYSSIIETEVQAKVSAKQKIFTTLVAVGILALLPLVYPKDSPIIPKDEEVTVQPGDTIYGFVAKEYDGRVNVNNAIYVIMKDNGIRVAGDLKVGQVVYFPVLQQ